MKLSRCNFIFFCTVVAFGLTVSAADTVRIIVTPKYELQPYDTSLTPCPNVSSTDCLSGWPRLNARVRQLRSEVPNSVFINSVDESSRLVLFHPDSYSVNHVFADRSKSDVSTIEGYVLLSSLEKRTVAFAAKATRLPVLTNLPTPNIMAAQISRSYSVVKVGGYSVVVMCMFHSSLSVHPTWNEAETIRSLLPPVKELYNADLVVLKMILPDDLTLDWSERLSNQGMSGVDIVIGVSTHNKNTTIVTRNGTTYIMQGLQGQLLGVMDVDMITRAVRYSEQNLLTEISPTLSSQQEYKDDVAFLKSVVDTAGKNDPVIGNSTADYPAGKPLCRIHECEQGNLWTRMLWDMSPEPVDMCIINGGAMRSGWKAGPFKTSYLFVSSPFQEQACIFSMWGADLWSMMNYSVHAVPPVANDTTGYDGTGRFFQTKGLRVEYNSNRNMSATQQTRLITLDVWNPTTNMYEPLSRRRQYRILTTRYVCNGGDGYNDYLKPTNGYVYLPQEIHNTAQQWLSSYKLPITPFTDGHIRRNLTSNKEFVLLPLTQLGCQPNTMWNPDVQDCDPCPMGLEQPFSGQINCIQKRVVTSDTSDTVIVVYTVVPVLVVVVLVAFVVAGQQYTNGNETHVTWVTLRKPVRPSPSCSQTF